ncbi:glycosyltransferase family protein [Nonlabens marinus]|uniref:UDP-glycosyltransferase n=1 Tax=Nonlabens marinus S1-08 TaxID=1454201 RepID=W8W056_9FLAO|nr:glycosyltransferase family 1 protein [Nonlabens marinus]BAO55741.1 hypothetical protein NMS_1732 [Nonlabens marinus S1-08]
MFKRILILAETIDSNSSSAGKANHAMIQSLHAAGFKIKIYHFSHDQIYIDQIEVTLIKEIKSDLNYWLSRSQRVLQRLSKRNFSKQLENLFGFSFTFKNDAFSMARALEKESITDFDLLLTLSKGASYRTHAALLKLPQWHNKWLAYIHDPYPFHWYPNPYNWIEAGYKFKEAFFVQVIKKAQYLGYPSQNLATWMSAFNDQFAHKAVILPHQADATDFDINNLPEFFNVQDFNVLHAGNLMTTRDPQPLILAWKEFILENPNAKKNARLTIVGHSQHFRTQLELAAAQDESIIIQPFYMDYKVVRAMESFASVNIILEAVAKESPFLPGKFPGLVIANAPILHLGPSNSETRRLLGKNYLYAAEADDVQYIKELLNNLFNKWQACDKVLLLDRADLDEYVSPIFLKQQIQKLN